MKNQTDILNEVFEKYKDKFSGFFHTTLWNIMVNNVHEGKVVAFTTNYNQQGILQLGLAYANEAGFSPAPAHFNEDIKYNDAQDVVDDMNSLIFKLDTRMAWEIVATSMRKP